MAGLLCSAEELGGEARVGTNESRVCLLEKLFMLQKRQAAFGAACAG